MTEARSLLAAELRSRRKRSGWSQAKLAERCALSGKTIWKIEAGQMSPTLETLLLIACRGFQKPETAVLPAIMSALFADDPKIEPGR